MSPLRSAAMLATMVRCLLVCIGMCLLLPAQGWCDAAPLPWKAGDKVGSQSRQFDVETIERAAEFVRLTVRASDGGKRVVEVRFGAGKPGPYSTGLYAVQPGVGQSAADGSALQQLILDLVDQLKQWQEKQGHRAFVAELTAKKPRPTEGGGAATKREATWSTPNEHGWGRHWPWLALNLLAFAMCVWLAGWRVVIPLAGAVSAFALLSEVPLWAINSLQEGGTGVRIEQLYGHGIHAGANYTAIAHALTGGDGYGITSLARINVCLWVLASGLFAAWAMQRVGLLWGVVLAAVFALNGIFVNGSTSELPSMLIACYIGLAALAVTAVDGRTRRGLLAGGGTLLLLTSLLWGTRREMIVVPCLAMFIVALERLPSVIEPLARLQSACKALSWRRRAAINTAVVSVVMVGLLPVAGRALHPHCSEHWCYLALAMQGEELVGSLAWLPGFLVGTALPVGVGLLLIVAMVRTLFAPLACLGLGLSTLLLYRVYFVAGHGITLEHYELYRYATLLVPLCMMWAVEALVWLLQAELYERFSTERRRLLAAVALVTMVVFPALGSGYDPPWPQSFARNQQAEVRTLLHWTAQYPDCAFVSVVARNGGGDDQHATELALFGRRGGGVNPERYRADRVADLLSDTRHLSCTMFYAGFDCSAVARSCERFTRQGAIAERRFEAARYLADHFARPPAEGTLQITLHPLDLAKLR